MKVKVSIIIPMFNSGLFIIEMIDCIIRQTYSNWELIIVDDVSTDGTYEKVINYTNNENRIKLIQRDRLPKGAQTCRNIGFENSIGKYVVYFDADDLISENCLKQRVQFMESNPFLDFAVFPAQTFRNGQGLGVDNFTKFYGINKNKDVMKSFLQAEYLFTVWTNIYKRDSILDLPWDEKLVVLQDFDYNISSLFLKKRFAFSDSARIDYFYRLFLNKKTITSNFVSTSKCQSNIYLFTKTLNILKTREDYVIRRKQFFSFIILHYERLIMSGKKVKLEEYLEFCQQYYSFSKMKSMRIISSLTINITSIRLKRAALYFSLYLRFGHYKYLRVLLIQLKNYI
jgi:glycosyltransferase involved in cell wall biosynthesis